MRTAIPGRGALRSQGTNPHQPTYNRKQRGAPGWRSLLFWSGKRDLHSRCARVCSRERLLTPPAPGRGALRSPGDEGPFSSHISTRKGEPFWFSLLLWSGKRDSHSRCARVFSREQLLTPPAPGRGALRSQGTRARSLRTFQREKGEPFWFSLFSLSGKRDSDPRPQPWQGCALPTELFPHDVSLNASAKVTKISESPNFSRPKPHFFVFSQDLPLCLPILYLPRGWQQRLARAFGRSPAGFPVPAAGTVRYQPLRHRQAPRRRPRSDTSFVFLHGILLEILSL